MSSLALYLKIIVLTSSMQLNYGCGPKAEQFSSIRSFTAIQDLDWLVGIFRVENESPEKSTYVHQCLGVLISPKTVLASHNCVPTDAESYTKVRYYEWKEDNLSISRRTPYKQRDVASIFPTEQAISILLLVHPINVQPDKFLRSMFDHSQPTMLFMKDEFVPHVCILLTMQPTINDDMALKFKQILTMFMPDCCYEYGYTLELITDLVGYYQADKINTDCYKRFSGITCFRTFDDCKAILPSGPVLCADENRSAFLYGFAVNKNRCILEVANNRQIDDKILAAIE